MKGMKRAYSMIAGALAGWLVGMMIIPGIDGPVAWSSGMVSCIVVGAGIGFAVSRTRPARVSSADDSQPPATNAGMSDERPDWLPEPKAPPVRPFGERVERAGLRLGSLLLVILGLFFLATPAIHTDRQGELHWIFWFVGAAMLLAAFAIRQHLRRTTQSRPTHTYR
jgi:hypothetical protein